MPVYVVCILERATFAVKKNGDTVKRVVVTGATGAIGRSLIKVCIKAGYEVLAIVTEVHRGLWNLNAWSTVMYYDLI